MIQRRTIIGADVGPHLLITGGVHGDEYEPMAAARQLISRINPSRLSGRVTIAPVVNEAAFFKGARAAEDGLDLARTCPGDPRGSITQRIAAELSQMIRDADYYIDMHTGGAALRMHTLSGYMLHPDAMILDTQRRMARAFDLPLIWGTSPNLEGRSLSVARAANVPAIYVEAGGGGSCEDAIIDAYVHGCLNVMMELKMLPGSPQLSAARKVVEDPRDASGFLQIQHPSSASGFFEPAVQLGTRVEAGTVIGAVVDPLGIPLGDVAAAESGIVVMLRAARNVRQGDALAALASQAGDKA